MTKLLAIKAQRSCRGRPVPPMEPVRRNSQGAKKDRPSRNPLKIAVFFFSVGAENLFSYKEVIIVYTKS